MFRFQKSRPIPGVASVFALLAKTQYAEGRPVLNVKFIEPATRTSQETTMQVKYRPDRVIQANNACFKVMNVTVVIRIATVNDHHVALVKIARSTVTITPVEMKRPPSP